MTNSADFRLVFDRIPEQFDVWRPRYGDELFTDLIRETQLGPGKTALEIGQGTGQATEPVLKTGCSYLAIELGEHLAAVMRRKFSAYDNFRLVNDDFETHDFGMERFDLVYSAAAIQWIPEDIAFPKSYALLKNGGTLAMMRIHSDYKSPNEALYKEIQKVYAAYFHPEREYTCHLEYENATNYGFADFRHREYYRTREYDADGYVSLIGTHCDHIVLQEPDRSRFFEGVRKAIQNAGGKILVRDTIALDLAKKP